MSGDIFPFYPERKTKDIFTYLKLNQIDSRDETFRFTDEEDYSRLKKSISRVGVLHPLVLQKKGATHRIVSGFKRFHIAKALNLSQVPVRVLDKKINPELTFEIALLSHPRKYRPLEKARALLILKKLRIPRCRIVQYYLPLLDLPANEYYLESYLEILNFSSLSLNYLSEHQFSLKQIQVFNGLSHREQNLLIDIAEEFKLRGLELQNIVTDLKEISRRDNQSIYRILKGMNLPQFLQAASGSRSNRLSQLKKLIREKRYPELMKINQELKIIKKELRINCPHCLNWDESLERPGLRLLLDITGPEEIQCLIRDLSNRRNIFLLTRLLKKL